MLSIIGGGISGLSVAYFLHQRNLPYQLFEATDRVGGKIETLNTPFGHFESGPNTLFADKFLNKLISDLGISQEVTLPSSDSKKRYILKGGRYHCLSDRSLWFFKNDFLTWKSKLALVKELFKPPNSYEDPSIADFFTYRFDKQINDYLVNPFVQGIYGSLPENLNAELAFPKIVQYEKEYGSIIKGFLKNRKNLERRRSLNFKQGIETLPLVLASKLNINLSEKIEAIEKKGSDYTLISTKSTYKSSKIIFTIPTFNIKPLLQSLYSEITDSISKVSYTDITVIHFVFDKKATNFNFNGFGALHPSRENMITAGVIWRSTQDKYILLTTFLVNKDKTAVNLEQVSREIKYLYRIQEEPLEIYIKCWQQAIPVYNKNLKFLLKQLPPLEKQNLYFCGNWVGGIGVSDCIINSYKLVEKLVV